MAFYRVSTESVSLAILCALATLSLRFHSARNACTALARRPRCADDVLKTQALGIFPPFRSFGQGPVEFGKIACVPSKFGNIYWSK